MRLLQLLKSKLHYGRFSSGNPAYVGCIEIDGELMKHVGIRDGEMVQIWAVDHSSRLNTYAFAGPKGVIGLNGGAARYFNEGDRLIICAFTWTDEEIVPQIVLLDEKNEIVRDMTPFTITG